MLAYTLVGLGVVLRLMPHLPNFTPIAAIALFGGVYLKRGHALLLPVAALFISDLFIGFDSWRGRAVVCGSFMLVGLIGLLIRKRKSLASVIGGSLAGSLAFYLITNFALLYPQAMYPHTLQGVMQSYINALPFFRYSLLGDLIYTGLLFGAYELILHTHKEKVSASGDLYPLH